MPYGSMSRVRFPAMVALVISLVIGLAAVTMVEAEDSASGLAQYLEGVELYLGEGVPQDYAEVARKFRVAAEQGVVEAQFNLGVMYRKGEGVPQDDVEAARWYRLAAEMGDADAQFSLGLMYYEGEGVAQSFVLAYM